MGAIFRDIFASLGAIFRGRGIWRKISQGIRVRIISEHQDIAPFYDVIEPNLFESAKGGFYARWTGCADEPIFRSFKKEDSV
jgi:hypothetical protein